MLKSKRLFAGIVAVLMVMILVIASAFTGAKTVKAEEDPYDGKVVQALDGVWENKGYGKDGWFILSQDGIYSSFVMEDDECLIPSINNARDPTVDYLGFWDDDAEKEILEFGGWNGNYTQKTSWDYSTCSFNSLLAPGSNTRTAPRLHNSWTDTTNYVDENIIPGGWILQLRTLVDDEYITLFVNSHWSANITSEMPATLSVWQNMPAGKYIVGQSKIGTNQNALTCTEENLSSLGLTKVSDTITLTSNGNFVTFKTGAAGTYYFLFGNPTFDPAQTQPNVVGTETKWNNPTVCRPLLNGIFFDADFNASINYVLDGGTNGNNPTSYAQGVGVASLDNASKAGYNFDGWYSDAEFTKKVESIGTNVVGDVILYAKFTKIPDPPKQDTETDDKEDKADNGGCGSVIGSTLALVSLVSLGAGLVVANRKKED